METLSETEFSILENLKTFRFLTADQFMRLHVTKNKRHLYSVLRGLRERKKPLINHLEHGVAIGRLPRLHYLTKHGAALLAEGLYLDPEAIPYPRGEVSFRQDFVHRIACIDCQIAVHQWTANEGGRVDFYLSYFESTGANRRPKHPRRQKTKLDLQRGSLAADAIFQITAADNQSRIFALEVQRGKRTKDTADKILKYRPVIAEKAINRQFDYPHAPRILFVFEEERVIELVRERLAGITGLESFYPFFFFKTLEGFFHDFKNGWQTLQNETPIPLF